MNVIPHCVFCYVTQPTSIHVVGFCDVSTKVYATVVYMRLESASYVNVKFMASRHELLQLLEQPFHDELLSALLLSKLITTTRDALKAEVHLSNPRIPK